MPAFGNRPSPFDPCDDFHGREDHKQQHHNAEGKGEDDVHRVHMLQPIEGVDKLPFIRCLEGEGFQDGAVVVVNGECVSREFKVCFPPGFFESIHPVKYFHVTGFFLERVVPLFPDLQTAETFLEIIGAEGVNGLIDPLVFDTALTLYISGNSKDEKTDREGEEEYSFH